MRIAALREERHPCMEVWAGIDGYGVVLAAASGLSVAVVEETTPEVLQHSKTLGRVVYT